MMEKLLSNIYVHNKLFAQLIAQKTKSCFKMMEKFNQQLETLNPALIDIFNSFFQNSAIMQMGTKR